MTKSILSFRPNQKLAPSAVAILCMSAGMFSKQEKTDHFVLCVALKKKIWPRNLHFRYYIFFREGDEINLCVSNCWIQKNDQQKKKSSKLSSERTIPEFEALEN